MKSLPNVDGFQCYKILSLALRTSTDTPPVEQLSRGKPMHVALFVFWQLLCIPPFTVCCKLL